MERRTVEVRVFPATIRETVATVAKELSSNAGEEKDWSGFKESTLWYELGACILGSQVRFEQAVVAAQQLKVSGLLSRPPDLRRIQRFEHAVARLLLKPLRMKNGRRERYRFPFSRARWLRGAAVAIYANGGSIRGLLKGSHCGQEARERLVNIVPGIGPKQASLFLRNVGYADDLAVLDVHVLRYMTWVQGSPIVRAQLQSLREYERLEGQFRSLADEMGFSVWHLDLAIWVTVRVVMQEEVG